MNPSDGPFLVFLALVVPVFALLAARRGKVPVLFLVFTSLFFYATWNPAYLIPLTITALVDYTAGRGLERGGTVRSRRAILFASMAVNLTLLACFKYFDAMTALSMHLPGLDQWRPHFRILFMTGISFYTFQSMSYVLDVYRRDQPAQRSFLRYLAFVSFFPTLLAGPITRADTLMPQLEGQPRAMDPDLVGKALFLIALGFIKKCIIADYLAESLVNRIFEQPLFYSGLEVLSGIYAYAVQVYCDFSGYSDIAIGAALLLGFRLKDNFRSPYRAASLAEFWQRWHISFSTWLRDYVFFSFPSVRKRGMAMCAIVATFILGGLWHGASWCFLIWGLIHGLGLAAERLFESKTRKALPTWRKAIGIVLTFHIVLAAWVFFRAENLETVSQIGQRLSDMTMGAGNIPGKALVFIVLVLASQAIPETWIEKSLARFMALPAVLQAALLVGSAVLVRFASAGQIAPFIYQGF